MEKKRINLKNVILNSLIVFIISLAIWSILDLYSDYSYYKAVNMYGYHLTGEQLFRIFRLALYWSVRQSIIFIPLLIILEKTKLYRILKIVIAIFVSGYITMVIGLFS